MRSSHKRNLAALLSISGAAVAQQTAWGQCGGQGWSGATSCVSGYTCSYTNDWYSQCVPGSSGGGGSNPTTTTTMIRTTTTASSSGPTGGAGGGKVRFAGVNIAGFDFGVVISGTQDMTQIVDESVDGVNQMRHFVNDDGFNIFRLPSGWQFLVNNNLGGSLDSNNFAKYDKLVQGCLSLGAYCIVDVHNYARWNGGVIGQGGPTDDQFTSLWTQLATHYKSESKIIFGVMNEPHDLDINRWATTVQKAVTAIRKAGATSQMILLPGTDFTSAANFVENGSGAALSAVTNLDGSTTNLIFDVHKYLDSDNSGTHAECVTNNADAFNSLAQWLRTNKRQAMLTETGGGNVQSCGTYMCQQLDVLNQNSDVYLGWTSWSAGGFQVSWNYVLGEVPTNNVDTYLVKQCFVPKWKN
ncbi:Endoglucanase EG-II [Penicillium oxalicum]|uniref:Endoglucanase EG-II n=2 Tax=Penicillium TaxID=5073 RepID=A9Z054_PENDC|nr:Endoglucanase EG-II [Penicillium oxalicum]ABY28340.1 endoglucanase II [Penicillium decumbens]EPS25573.1 endo-beta-1,4-glucanase Cel5A [Penicillium oxalicum 114-2]KAI2791095.1 Endoglucanase EG-II [Penicillium oxalicum]